MEHETKPKNSDGQWYVYIPEFGVKDHEEFGPYWTLDEAEAAYLEKCKERGLTPAPDARKIAEGVA